MPRAGARLVALGAGLLPAGVAARALRDRDAGCVAPPPVRGRDAAVLSQDGDAMVREAQATPPPARRAGVGALQAAPRRGRSRGPGRGGIAGAGRLRPPRTRWLARAAATALAALLLAPQAVAEVAVEYYTAPRDGAYGAAEGVIDGRETLYPLHRALVIGESTGAPAEREALLAWLETRGLSVEDIPGGADAMARAMAWVAGAEGAADAGLVVVIDAPVTRDWGPDGQRLTLRLEGGGTFDLDRFMGALDRLRARHVLVIFATPVPSAEADWARPEAPPAPERPWLTAEAGRAARQAIVPVFEGAGVIGLMVEALSQAPGAARREFFDPDRFVTAGDLAAMRSGLALWRFGEADAGGETVLMARAPVLLPFGREHPRDAYARVRGDLGGQAIDAFLAGAGETPTLWHRAALAQRRLIDRRVAREAAAECDAALGYDTDALLSLNAGVLARLPQVSGMGALARAWRSAIAAAGGIDGLDRTRLDRVCAGAETRPEHAPDRALSLALASAAPEAGIAVVLGARRDWPGRRGAAVLAGLQLLAEGPGTARPGDILAPLEAAADRGHAPAQLVLAMLLLDGTHVAADPDRAAELLTRAESRVPVAAALHAALRLSPDPVVAGWRGRLAEDSAAALASLRRARRAGVAIDPGVLDRAALADRLLAACESALGAMAPERLLDLDRLGSEAEIATFLGEPQRYLAHRIDRAEIAAARRACADLPAAEALPESLRARHDAIQLARALGDMAAGAPETASARLKDLATPLPGAAVALALLDPGAAERGALEAAERALPAAGLVLAAAELSGPEPERQAAGLARLRALGDEGHAAADAALAMALVRDPEAGGLAPAAALTEAALRIYAANQAGFPINLSASLLQGIADHAAAGFGLAFSEVTPDHAALLGTGEGVLVAQAGAGPLDPGDVVVSIGGQAAATPAAARLRLFSQALLARLGGGTVTLIRRPLGAREAGPVSLPLPDALAAVPVPARLRP